MDVLPRVCAVVALLVLDLVWIRLFMLPAYERMVPQIQRAPLRVGARSAVAAYALMVVGQQVFVLTHGNAQRAFLFGIVLYGVYDATCAAVFDRWDPVLALKDVLWGGTVYLASYGVATAVG